MWEACVCDYNGASSLPDDGAPHMRWRSQRGGRSSEGAHGGTLAITGE